MRRIASQKSRAFTLIELLLALALSVMVLAVLTSAAFTAFHARASINNAVDISRKGDQTDMMARELANALVPTTDPNAVASTVSGLGASQIQAPNPNMIGSFEGLTDSVDFFTSGPEPKADMQPDVREVVYLLVDGPNGTHNLSRRVVTNVLPIDLTATAASNPPPDEIVIENVDSISFQYWSTLDQGWLDTWDSTAVTNAIPMAVQVTITFPALKSGGQSRTTTRIIPLYCAQPMVDPNAATTGVTQ